MRFGLPIFAWFALAAVPVVIFYFLKLRRPRVVIPSIFLWRQAIQDQRVNSPFQRFKRNWLLWLQLLLLALAVLAGMQPFLRSGAAVRDRLPILLDLSASMAAPGADGTRLDEAKRRARARIEALGRGQQAALHAFARSAREVQGFTDNPRLLLAALDRLKVDDTAGDLEEALRLAVALHRRDGFERALLISDGNLAARAGIDLPFRLEFERVPATGGNLGITAFNARRSPRGSWEALVELRAAGAEPRAGALEVLVDGQPHAREAVQVAPGEAAAHTLELPGDRPARLEARLLPVDDDALAADNRAVLDLPAIHPLRVWIDPGLPLFQRAFDTRRERSTRARDPGESDLAVLRAGPPPPGVPVALVAGALPPELQGIVEPVGSGVPVVDWQRAHPLFRHVTFQDLLTTDGARYASGRGEADVERAGFTVLVHGGGGPLAVADTRRRGLVVWMLFNPESSTLPFRVGFPVLLENLARLAHQQRGTEEVAAVATGVLSDRPAAPGATVTWTDPDGLARSVQADDAGLLRGLPAPRAGDYTMAEGSLRSTVHAALLDAGETEMKTLDRLTVGEVPVEASVAQSRSDRPLWRGFLLAALAAMLVEWYGYNRRPGGARVAG